MGQEEQRHKSNQVKSTEDKYLAKEPAVGEITGSFFIICNPNFDEEDVSDNNFKMTWIEDIQIRRKCVFIIFL